MATKKFKNTVTGEIKEFEIDSQGNRIDTAQPVESSILRTDPTKPAGIRASTLADQIFNYGGRFVPQALSAAGGIGGGIAGTAIGQPIIGSAVGTGIGSGIGSALKYAAPQLFGENKSPVTDAAIDIGSDVAFGGLGKAAKLAFPSGRNAMIQHLIKEFFPGNLTPEVAAAIKADPEFKLSVGQVNPTAGTIEKYITPTAKDKLVSNQRRNLINKVTANVRNPEDIIQEAQAFGQTRKEAFQKKSQDLYKDFEPAIKYNTKTVLKEVPGGKPTGLVDPQGNPILSKSTFEPVKIEGAIPLKKSKGFSDNLLSKIDEILGPNDINVANIGESAGAHLKFIRNELNKISGVQTHLDPKTMKPTATYGQFEQLKEIRDSLERFTKSSEYDVMKDKLQGPLSYLKKALRSDIDEGVKSWGSNSYGRFRKAQDFWSHISNRLNPKMTRDLLAQGIDPETTAQQVLKTATSDPQIMDQFISMGGRDKATELFRGELSKEIYNPITGSVDIAKGIDYLNSNDSVARRAVPSNVLGNAKRLLARSSIIGDAPSGSISPLMKMGSGGISMGLGALNMAAGHGLDNSALYGTMVLAGASAINKFAEKILFNSKNARIAAGLLDADPTSKAAKVAQQFILNSLRGARIIYRTPDGRELPGQLDNQGKVKLDSQK